MAALDTNILVRYLVEDDTTQLAAAKKLIRAAVRAGDTIYVPITVMLELEWVLRSNFGFAKNTVAETLSALLSAAELSFESESALEVAFALFQANSADFSDCVHIALAHAAGESPLWTFDKAAAKVDGARLLR
ncbi:PIN domain-containing protein [Polaromonas sp.]|uniref:PIN domain-containing protein n=1 Tax=Polaromonas sp. TaxID=1869339 RepID=UPI002FC994B8